VTFYVSALKIFLLTYLLTYWWSFGTESLSLTVYEIFNGEGDAIVDVTLKSRPLKTVNVIHFGTKGIPYIRFPIGCQ